MHHLPGPSKGCQMVPKGCQFTGNWHPLEGPDFDGDFPWLIFQLCLINLEALAIRGVQSFSTQWNDPHRVSWSFLPGWLAYMRGWNTSHLQRDYFISHFLGSLLTNQFFYGRSLVGFDHSDEDDCTVATCFVLENPFPLVCFLQNPC